MGGGRRRRRDVPRRGGRDLLRSVAEIGAAGAANGGSLAMAAEFCAREHRVPIRIEASQPPARGDPVRLVSGNPPIVMNGAGQIGAVLGAAASALNGCLELDWEMTGRVESVNPAAREGLIVVAGVR
jgi:hypothetical protein